MFAVVQLTVRAMRFDFCFAQGIADATGGGGGGLYGGGAGITSGGGAGGGSSTPTIDTTAGVRNGDGLITITYTPVSIAVSPIVATPKCTG